jgi:hypothetical protein
MWEDSQGMPLTADADRRLTRVGVLLAKTRLDEMPQLWHVLRGEMSLVGPRPEDPSFVAEHAIAYEQILTVRPGLTGFAQLAFAEERRIISAADPIADYLGRILPQKCRLDLLYVRERSVLTNLRVLVWTLIAVLLRFPVAVNRATGTLNLRRRVAPARPRRGRRFRRSLSTPLEPVPVAGSDRERSGGDDPRRLVVAEVRPEGEDPRRRRAFPRGWATSLSGSWRRRGEARRARRMARRSAHGQETPHGHVEARAVVPGTTDDEGHTEVVHEGCAAGGGHGDALASLHDGDPQAARSGR